MCSINPGEARRPRTSPASCCTPRYTMFRTTATLARAPFAMRRPFTSAAVLSRARLLAPAPPFTRVPAPSLRGQLFVRGAASSVSGKPGSQTIRQAAINIREELGNSGADLAKTIAGANWFHDAVAANPKRDTFVSAHGPDVV